MSCSAPNSRCSSPPAAGRSSHGGSRPGSGSKRTKKSVRAAAAAAGGAALVANLQHRQRLVDGISSLSNAASRSLSSNELRIILRIALCLQLQEDYSEAQAIDAASVWAGSSRHTIEPAYRHWWDTGELLESDDSQRGSGNPLHPRHDSSLSLDPILAIHSLLAEAKNKDEFMLARKVKQRLNLPLNERQTRRVIRQMGYRWGRKRCVGTAGRKQQQQRMRLPSPACRGAAAGK